VFLKLGRLSARDEIIDTATTQIDTIPYTYKIKEKYINNANSGSHTKGYKAVYLYKKKNKWYI
jgi:hypothetical protein